MDTRHRYPPPPPRASTSPFTYGTVEQTPLMSPNHQYGSPYGPTRRTSWCNLRRILIALGFLWVGGVLYLSSLANQILLKMEERPELAKVSPLGMTTSSVQQSSSVQQQSEVAKQPSTSTSKGSSSSSSSSVSSSTTSSSSSSHTPFIYHKHSSSHTTTKTTDNFYTGKNVTILVVYGPEYHNYISMFAWHVALGVNASINTHANIRHPSRGILKFGTTYNLTFTDVLNADAILLGSPVYNGNTHPNVQTWLNYWHIEADLSKKIGAAFVTAGGMHAGADSTLLSLLRSMMIFQMITVGGDSWDSPFGAAATMSEDPFGDVERGHYFNDSCYQTDSLIHPYFLRKAFGLGERVANVTFAMQNSTLWTMTTTTTTTTSR